MSNRPIVAETSPRTLKSRETRGTQTDAEDLVRMGMRLMRHVDVTGCGYCCIFILG